MATKGATYSTILPDDTPMYNPYQKPDSRQHRQSQQQMDVGQRPMREQHRLADVHNDLNSVAPAPGTQNGPITEKEQLNNHINTNKTFAYGLLFVVAILLIVIGYQAFQQRKQLAEVNQVQQNPVTSGDDPPSSFASGQSQQIQHEQQWPNTGYSDQQQNTSSANARDSQRNDRILKQSQRKQPRQGQLKSQSAMRRRQGCTEEDDRRRLDTIVEENDPGDDQVRISERTRSIIAEQLQQDAFNDSHDESLGGGSVDVVDADTAARRDLRKAEIDSSPLQDERDEALVEQEDPQDDEDIQQHSSPPIVVLCSQILATGTRAGQECQRECKPGNTKCNSHLARGKK